MYAATIPARGRVAAVAAAVLLGLAGCASDDSPTAPTTDPTPVPSPTATAEPSPPPSSAPSPTAPPETPTETATPAVALTLKQRLLPSASVPGLNARWQWQDGKTRQAGTKPFGLCAKVDLGSIGATQVLERIYYPPDDSDDNAAQQVAQFADTKSATQAWSVLGSWHSACAGGANADLGLNVRGLSPITVAVGQARWYLVSWEPEGEETGRFEALGMVRNGTTISVLRMTNSSQDYNYPVGQEPMVGMVQKSADLLAK